MGGLVKRGAILLRWHISDVNDPALALHYS